MCRFDQACPPGCTGTVDPQDPFTPGRTAVHRGADTITSISRIIGVQRGRFLASKLMRRYRDAFEEDWV
jgi:hypothetical protein